MMFQAEARAANMKTPASVRRVAASATAGAARAAATAAIPTRSPRRFRVTSTSGGLDAGFVERAAEQAGRAHDEHCHQHGEGDGVDQRPGEVLAAPCLDDAEQDAAGQGAPHVAEPAEAG